MTYTIEDRSAEIVADIQNLQSVETDLFNNLETGIANKTLTADQQTALVEQINKVSSMRESLYQGLYTSQNYYRNTASNVGGILQNQINALDVVENQMDAAKARLKIIEEEKNNKLRLVEINTYYGEKYEDHTSIMKTIIYFCIPIIILAILANSNILPHSLYVLLFVIIVVAALVVVGRKIIDSLSRDNMNYQEYAWGNGPPVTPAIDTSNPFGVDPWTGQGLTCVAQECCDTGFTYVPSPTNKCIANASLPANIKPYDPTASSGTTGTASSTTPATGFLDSLSSTAQSFTTTLSNAASDSRYAASTSVASVYDSYASL